MKYEVRSNCGEYFVLCNSYFKLRAYPLLARLGIASIAAQRLKLTRSSAVTKKTRLSARFRSSKTVDALQRVRNPDFLDEKGGAMKAFL
jgi:hypothetical protein